MADFSEAEGSEDSFALTPGSPNHVSASAITLPQPASVAAFTAAQYAGVEFWALDASNAQRLLNGPPFQGYRINQPDQAGLSFVKLPAGSWWVGVVDRGLSGSQTVTGFDELSWVALPGGYSVNNIPMSVSGNAGAWKVQSFSITGNPLVYIETEGSGGEFMIMSDSQLAPFEAANPQGYTGGRYSYYYALGGQNGGPATEIEGQLQLSPGNWNLVWINTTGQWAGGAANMTAFGTAGSTGGLQAVATPAPPTNTTTPTSTPTQDPQVLGAYDTTSRSSFTARGETYAGPVAGLQQQYINMTPDSINITAQSNNWFIHTGAGDDAIAVSGGTNVLDGGTGSNFLTGGSGADTFFVDDRTASADIWSTVAGFHAGDAATIWGVTPQAFTMDWFDNQGAAGYTGLTVHAMAAGRATASLTLAGYTKADLTNGRLSVTFGTDPASGSAFMYIHGDG